MHSKNSLVITNQPCLVPFGKLKNRPIKERLSGALEQIE
jgi:hypothetical protein